MVKLSDQTSFAIDEVGWPKPYSTEVTGHSDFVGVWVGCVFEWCGCDVGVSQKRNEKQPVFLSLGICPPGPVLTAQELNAYQTLQSVKYR